MPTNNSGWTLLSTEWKTLLGHFKQQENFETIVSNVICLVLFSSLSPLLGCRRTQPDNNTLILLIGDWPSLSCVLSALRIRPAPSLFCCSLFISRELVDMQFQTIKWDNQEFSGHTMCIDYTKYIKWNWKNTMQYTVYIACLFSNSIL